MKTMEQEYDEYIVYVDDHKFGYYIEKELVPKTNKQWYKYLGDNICDSEELEFLIDAKHIKIYKIFPPEGAYSLITKFDKEEVLEKEEEKGLKFDEGKPLVGTMLNVFPYALMEIGRVIEFGTHKYPSPINWRLVENGQKRYQDALMRHLLKHNQGKEIDEETGKAHLAHVAWNALAILELYLREKEGVNE